MNDLRVLGVMTGTSCDALDAACVSYTRGSSRGDLQRRLLWTYSAPYLKSLKKRVLEIQKPKTKITLKELLELDRDLGIWMGQTLAAFLEKCPADTRPHIIANHGQTVAHFPPKATLQLACPAQIAVKTRLSVVSTFRDGDLAAGGQGAPLVPLFHKLLGREVLKEFEGIAVHNLGGISNLSYFGPGNRTIAFDTGPANLWMDAVARKVSKGRQQFDVDGKLARSGTPHAATVRKLLNQSFFKKEPPKSTGRDDFSEEMILRAGKQARLSGADLMATALAVTIESVAQAYEKWIVGRSLPLTQVLLCGGGAKNPTLVTGLRSRMPQVNWKTADEVGLDSSFIEAEAFAYFGVLSLLGLPLGGSWTGCQIPEGGPAGSILPGSNWNEVKSWLSAQ